VRENSPEQRERLASILLCGVLFFLSEGAVVAPADTGNPEQGENMRSTAAIETSHPQGSTGSWTVSAAPDFGPIALELTRRASSWDEMVRIVREMIQEAGKSAAERGKRYDENAAAEAEGILAWLAANWRTREYAMRSRTFHVGRDSVCVQLAD
jgi:hypothetical protein